MSKKGFTLIELMVVIVIIGILAALAIPKFLGASSKAKASECKSVLGQIFLLEEAYKQERDSYTLVLNDLGFAQPASNARFSYTVSSAATTSFQGNATVNGAGKIKAPDGTDLSGQIASINQCNVIWAAGSGLSALLAAPTAASTCNP